MPRATLLCICLLFSLSLVAKAQTPPHAEAFNPQIEKLPANFVGLDIKAVYNDLSIVKATRGEFETTEEFQARVQREEAKPVLGKMAKSGYFAFQIYTGEGKAEILYDADRKIMTVAVFLLNNKRNLITRFEFNGRDKYEATNAFGAKTLVTRTAVTYYYLDFANYEDLGASRYLDAAASSLGLTYDNLYRDAQPRHSWAKDADKFARDAFVFSMPMDVATARRVKTNLKVLAVVRLVKPYDSQIDRHLAPTFDQPIETVERSYFLNTNLAELWVYDETTGEVFARRKVQSGSTLAPS